MIKGTWWSFGEIRPIFDNWSTIQEKVDSSALVCSVQSKHLRKSDVGEFLWVGEWGSCGFVGKVGLKLDLKELRIWKILGKGGEPEQRWSYET